MKILIGHYSACPILSFDLRRTKIYKTGTPRVVWSSQNKVVRMLLVHFWLYCVTERGRELDWHLPKEENTKSKHKIHS